MIKKIFFVLILSRLSFIASELASKSQYSNIEFEGPNNKLVLEKNNHNNSYSNLLIKGDIYLDMKQYKDALEIFLQLLGKNEKNPIILNRIGLANYLLKNYDSAMLYYNKAISISPQNPIFYNNRGVLFYALKKYELAKKEYLKAIELNPKYAKAMVNLAVAEFYLKNYLAAFQWYTKALSTDQKYIEERLDKEKAKKRLEELIKNNPNDENLKKIYQWVKKNYY